MTSLLPLNDSAATAEAANIAPCVLGNECQRV